jgi:hypothetical protein
MTALFTFALAAAAARPDSVPVRAVREPPAGVTWQSAMDTVPARPRRKAVEISDAYQTRLTIHQWASYATLPIFAAQAIVGEKLYNDDKTGVPHARGLLRTHDAIALSLGALFAVNTVTGGLNWWESRRQAEGRAWRTAHALLMLAADGGFAATAAMGSNGRYSQADRDRHKNWAIGSASVALASYVMMWKPFRRD